MKSREELEKDIIKFLDERSTKKGDVNAKCALAHGIASVLATSRNNIPRATPVDFFNEGLTIWIGAEPGGKIVNIKENPNVSIGIFTPVGDHSTINISIQVWGKAVIINMENNPEEYLARMKKWGMYDTLKNMVKERIASGQIQSEKTEESIQKYLKAFNMLRVEPEKITYLYIHPATGREKYTWTRDDK